MDLLSLSKDELKLILKTSQGLPAQRTETKARVKIEDADRKVSPKPTGHPLSSHVRGSESGKLKTKYCSLDDMALALELVLKTTRGQEALRRLQPGRRQTVSATLQQVFSIEAVIQDEGPTKFSKTDVLKSGL